MLDIATLARAARCSQAKLLAMVARQRSFRAAPARAPRTRVWFAELFERFKFGRGIHMRRIHYRLVSAGPAVSTPDGGAYLNTHSVPGDCS